MFLFVCKPPVITSISGYIRCVSIVYLAHGLKLHEYLTGGNCFTCTCTLEIKAKAEYGKWQKRGCICGCKWKLNHVCLSNTLFIFSAWKRTHVHAIMKTWVSIDDCQQLLFWDLYHTLPQGISLLTIATKWVLSVTVFHTSVR